MTAVSTSAFYDRAATDIRTLRARAESLQAAAGRGERLTRSSDDPVAASRLRQLARSDAIARIDTANANRASADLTLADDALSTMADFVIRAQELATQAASGTLAPSQRAAIGQELGLLHGNLVALANSRDSAGHALFGGETTGAAYSLDGSGVATYLGNGAAGVLELGEGLEVGRALTGPEFLNFNHNGAATDLLAVVRGLADALQGAAADPAAAARDALGALETGLDRLSTGQTVVGARLAWIDLTGERRIDQSELRSDEQGAIGGTDLAETVTRLQQTLTVLEASQASFAKLSGLSLFDVLR